MFGFLKKSKKERSLADLSKDIERLFIAQNIIKGLANKESFEQVAKSVLNEMETKMGYSGAALSVVNIEAKTIQLKYLSDSFVSTLSQKLKILDKKSFRVIPLYDPPITLTKKAAIENKVVTGTQIKDFTAPPMTERKANLIQTISRTKTMIAVPIRAQDTVIGVLNFPMRKEQSQISDNEMRTLELFTDQIGLIIDNIFKYEEIQNFNIQLKEEVERATEGLRRQNEDLESLFSLTSNVSQTLDPERVVQTAVNSIPLTSELVSIAVFSYDEHTQVLELQAVTENKVLTEVTKLVGGFENYTINTGNPDNRSNLLYQIIKNGKQKTSNQIKDILIPLYDEKTVSAIDRLMRTNLLHLYPLRAKDQPTGVIVYFLRTKDSKDENSTKQKEPNGNKNQLLATYAFQISIALENALLFQKSEQTQRYLREARRRERDMVDVMGHELRTPISIVRNALLALEMDYSKDGKVDDQKKLGRYLDMAIESTKREIRLIETLLSATKVEGNKIQLTLTKVDMKDVIHDAMEGQKENAVKKGLKINYKEPPEEHFAFVDRVRVQEVMDNFLNNSVKYTADGHVDIKIWEENDFIYIEVKDTGIGISKENQEKLGRKFFRVKELFEGKPNEVQPSGTGLGLFVTFNLIDIMRGERRLWSEKGKGSSFIFGFPKYLGQQDERLDQSLIADEGGEEVPESIIKEETAKLTQKSGETGLET
ncbi:MAG: ATP-binding protein [Candidatus Dojkabacteria bacterium]